MNAFVRTKHDVIENCCKNNFIRKQVKQTYKRCRTFGEILVTLETMFPRVGRLLTFVRDSPPPPQ